MKSCYWLYEYCYRRMAARVSADAAPKCAPARARGKCGNRAWPDGRLVSRRSAAGPGLRTGHAAGRHGCGVAEHSDPRYYKYIKSSSDQFVTPMRHPTWEAGRKPTRQHSAGATVLLLYGSRRMRATQGRYAALSAALFISRAPRQAASA